MSVTLLADQSHVTILARTKSSFQDRMHEAWGITLIIWAYLKAHLISFKPLIPSKDIVFWWMIKFEDINLFSWIVRRWMILQNHVFHGCSKNLRDKNQKALDNQEECFLFLLSFFIFLFARYKGLHDLLYFNHVSKNLTPKCSQATVINKYRIKIDPCFNSFVHYDASVGNHWYKHFSIWAVSCLLLIRIGNVTLGSQDYIMNLIILENLKPWLAVFFFT